MKIKKLSIHNIASIENAVIDFTVDPFVNEPIFLITGETGSGKTTILNSICLALYNTAPNIEGVQSVQNAARIGGLSINDPRQLMRQGTYDANVELVFEGNDGHDYIAKWDAHRSRTGNPQPTRISLTCLHNQLSLQGVREVLEFIESPTVVGLSYEQFCRTTMLAQGQFSKFMTSQDKDKSDILEKLTGTEVYARIGQKVNERFKTVCDALSAITNKIAGAKLMSAEERQNMGMMLKSSSESIEVMQKKLNELTAKYDWLKASETAKEAMNREEAGLRSLREVLESETVKARKDTVILWDNTAEIRSTLNMVKEKSDQLKRYRQQKEEKKAAFSKFIAGFEFVKFQVSDIENKLRALTAKQDAEAKNVSMYENIQHIDTLIGTIVEKSAVIKTQDVRIEKAEISKSRLAGPMKNAVDQVKAAEESLKKARLVVEEKNKEAQRVCINDLRNNVNGIENNIKVLNDCIGAVAEADKRIREKQSADAYLVSLKNKIDESQRTIDVQMSLLPEAKTKADSLYNQYQGKMDLRNHLVDLQKRFHDVQICPLCGSSVDGIHTESILDEEVAAAKAAALEADGKLKDIEKSINELKTVITTTGKLLGEAVKSADSAGKEKEKAESVVNDLLERFQLKYGDEGLGLKLEVLINTCKEKLQTAQNELNEGQGKLDAVEPARREEDNCRLSYEKLQADLDRLKKDIECIDAEIYEAGIKKSGAAEDCSKASEALASLLTVKVDLRHVDMAQFRQELKTKADIFAENSLKIKEYQLKLKELTVLTDNVRPVIGDLSVFFDMQDFSEEPVKLVDLDQKLRLFSMEVTQLSGAMENVKEQLVSEEKKAEEFFSVHVDVEKQAVLSLMEMGGDKIKNYRDEIRKIEDNIKQVEGAIKQIDGQLVLLNSRAPEFAPEETLDYLGDRKVELESALNQENEQRVQMKTRLEDDEKRAKAQEDDIKEQERLRHICNSWKILNDAFGGTNGDRFKRIAQSYVLRSLLEKSNYYLRMLNKRYELACTDGFLSISILDHHQGGAERNVSSLSGGEGFVVSLALALGLSAISKDKINVDTLFIDEGFGTLSSDYLETVISTLDKLHQLGGRRVGIISHVSELANRIPTQIQLKRTGPSSSKIDIVSY